MKPTFEGFKEFVKNKMRTEGPNDGYNFGNSGSCAFAQYLRSIGHETHIAVGMKTYWIGREQFKINDLMFCLDDAIYNGDTDLYLDEVHDYQKRVERVSGHTWESLYYRLHCLEVLENATK